MSKFNPSVKGVGRVKATAINKEGLPAYKLNLKETVTMQVLTTFFNEPKFYGDNSNEIVENVRELLFIDPEYVAKLALFAREQWNMRSVSHVLVAELAANIKGESYVKDVIEKVVKRPDDMQEILAYYLAVYGKPIPNSMKKGLAAAFVKFKEHTIAKYDGGSKGVKLKDILILTHPKPQFDNQSEMWRRLLEGNLEIPLTWETQISKYGNKKEVWENLIAENKLGYMAMLRNLRNMILAGVDMRPVHEYLTNEDNVLNSKQLPFRFYAAFKELSNIPTTSKATMDALESALVTSIKNIPKIPGKTLIAADVSGSMAWASPSKNSTMTSAEIAILLLFIGAHICEDPYLITFDTAIQPIAPISGSILQAVKFYHPSGGGTDVSLPMKYVLQHKIPVDRILVLSDNEMNAYKFGEGMYSRFGKTAPQSSLDAYKKQINPNVWLHGIDIMGYGTQQFAGHNTNFIAGWSEKVFNFINLAEQGQDALVKSVENYSL